MDKLKRYVECYIATETCNLRCHYCYIAQLGKFRNKLVKFEHTPEEIKKALSVERLGGKCLINLCAGGETLLAADVIPVIRALLEEGHYVMVVTNGTMTIRFQEIVKFPKELLERLIFKFSFHYLELIRINFLDKFFENIKLVRDAGCSFTLEITPNDELIPYIEDVKKVCMDKLGALCHVTIARDDRTDGIEILSNKSFDEYKKIWGQFDSNLFKFKSEIFYKKRKEFCYAGDWSIYVNLTTGDVKKCYFGKVIDNIFKNVDEPIHFEAMGSNCQLAHCYNGHSYLTLGDIPGIGNDVTYASLRNRKDRTGEWLNPKMKKFISQKLYYNNEEYNTQRKRKIDRNKTLKSIEFKTKKNIKKLVNKVNVKKNKNNNKKDNK